MNAVQLTWSSSVSVETGVSRGLEVSQWALCLILPWPTPLNMADGRDPMLREGKSWRAKNMDKLVPPTVPNRRSLIQKRCTLKCARVSVIVCRARLLSRT